MSEENVELARRYVEAFNAQGLEGTAHTRHPDIEMFDPPGMPEAGSYVGEAAIRARINEFMEVGWDGQFRNPEFLDADPEVAIVYENRATSSRGGGTPVELTMTVVHLWLFEGEKIRRIRVYLSREEGLEAAGLSE